MQVAVNADLPFHQLGRGANFEWFHLPELPGMEIQRSRGVALPDAHLPNGEFIYIQKHWLSPR